MLFGCPVDAFWMLFGCPLDRRGNGVVERRGGGTVGPTLRQHFGGPMGKASMPSQCLLMPFGEEGKGVVERRGVVTLVQL